MKILDISNKVFSRSGQVDCFHRQDIKIKYLAISLFTFLRNRKKRLSSMFVSSQKQHQITLEKEETAECFIR